VTRAVSTPLGVALLALVTVLFAAVVGAGTLGITGDAGAATGGGAVVLSGSATADGTVELVHRGGPSLDAGNLRVAVSVDGERLAHQPPVPFFAAQGFHGGPTGPFNPATDQRWSAGETASFRVAGTNDPELSAGRTVTVRVFHGGTPVATVETTVREP